jgi:hypothetical protein
MNVRPETAEAVRAAEALLYSAPQGELDPVAVEQRVGAAIRLLRDEAPQWITLAQATRLLGVDTDETPKTFARWGLLRSRTCGDDTLEVRLDDVLYRRLEAEGLLAFGGDELTPEELEMMHQATPGTLPWERERSKPSA